MRTTISPWFQVKLVFSQTLYSQSTASITMGSIASYLRCAGYDVKLCLMSKYDFLVPNDAINQNPTNNDIIIAKPNFKDVRIMLAFLKTQKELGKAKRIFLCGPLARLNAREILAEDSWVDGIIMDQPESSSMLLLSTISKDLMSWDVNSPGTISRNPRTGLIENYHQNLEVIPMSCLPFPARDIEASEDVKYVNIEASRGCVFDCSFCHIPLVWKSSKHSFRGNIRDPILVVNEIEYMNRSLEKTLFIFNDSCFWSTKRDDERIHIFCNEIMKRGLDIRLYVYLKGSPFIGDDLLERLVEAGLVRIFIGIENSVQSSLKLYRKKIRNDLYSTMKSKCEKLGINLHIGFISIEPYSSLNDVRQNIEYLFGIGKLFRLGVILEPVRIIPKSTLHARLVAEGLMAPNLNYSEVTYGYDFAESKVRDLLRNWKKLFEDQLKDAAFDFEYYSTVGELLKILAIRLDSKFLLLTEIQFNGFYEKRSQGMQLLLDYFMKSIHRAETSHRRDAIDDSDSYENQFSQQFTAITEDLKAQYTNIVDIVKMNGGLRATKEVYIPSCPKKILTNGDTL